MTEPLLDPPAPDPIATLMIDQAKLIGRCSLFVETVAAFRRAQRKAKKTRADRLLLKALQDQVDRGVKVLLADPILFPLKKGGAT